MGKPKSLKDHCRHCKRVIKWGPCGHTLAALLGAEHDTRTHGWNETWHHVELPEGAATPPTMVDLIRCEGDAGTFWRRAEPVSFCTVDQQNFNGMCNRPVKDRGMCGIHLKAAMKEEKEREEQREHREIQDHIKTSVEALCEKLAECGVSGAKAHYQPPGYGSQKGHYTGNIVVSPNELLKFLQAQQKPAKKKVKK